MVFWVLHCLLWPAVVSDILTLDMNHCEVSDSSKFLMENTMGTEIILGIRIDPQDLTTIKLSDINLKTKVEDLRHETAKRTNLSKESFELVYCGSLLEDEASLESYGLRNGSVVHVLRRVEPEKTMPVQPVTEDTILQIVAAYKSFYENYGRHSTLNRLCRRPDVIDNIISSSPGLRDDSVAIAMLQDTTFMGHFVDVDTVRRIAKLHPVLLEAAQNLAAAVREELLNTKFGPSNPSTSQVAGQSYSLDNMSDDEEMAGDSSQSSDSTQLMNIPSNSSSSGITTAQLSAALSRARGRNFPLSNSPSSTSASSTNSGVITAEMFSQAMQQAFSPPPRPVSPMYPPPFPTVPPLSALPPLSTLASLPTLPPLLSPILPVPNLTSNRPADLQRQLEQMHEIGLQDDSINVQALQFTNGDVQAAIELVFSGFNDD